MRDKPHKALWNQQRLKRPLEHGCRNFHFTAHHSRFKNRKKILKKIKNEEEEEEEEEEEGRDFISYLISICSLQRLWLYGR